MIRNWEPAFVRGIEMISGILASSEAFSSCGISKQKITVRRDVRESFAQADGDVVEDMGAWLREGLTIMRSVELGTLARESRLSSVRGEAKQTPNLQAKGAWREMLDDVEYLRGGGEGQGEDEG